MNSEEIYRELLRISDANRQGESVSLKPIFQKIIESIASLEKRIFDLEESLHLLKQDNGLL